MSEQLTNTVGYFNGNKWPLHIFISELNTTLVLPPGEYIKDPQGNKINDPFFDREAKAYRLSKEVSDKQVPLVKVPVVTAITPRSTSHPVREVKEFTQPANPTKQTLLLAPPPPVLVSTAYTTPGINKMPVTAMSVEEARNSGLIKHTRRVPEDYGVTDTEGLPPVNIPTIKYEVDSTRGPKPAPLPTGLLENTTATPPQTPQQLIEESAPPPLFGNQVLKTSTTHPTTISKVAAPRAPVRAITAPVVETKAPAKKSRTTVAIEDEMPVPNVPAEEFIEDQEDFETAPEEAPEEAPQPIGSFVCAGDGKTFTTRAELEGHVKKVFPKFYKQLMAHYPAS